MGAWGIGLCALKQIGVECLEASTTLHIERILHALIVERSEFQCHDKDCATLCPIQKTRIQVDEAEHTAISGGACPKYETSGKYLPKLPKEAPNPF
ncbi:MAG: hypothetical protein WCI05_16935, partial [Myxococcales bacterium]